MRGIHEFREPGHNQGAEGTRVAIHLRTKAVLACLIIAMACAGPAAFAEKTQTLRFGVWKLQTRFDSFAGQNICRLRADYIDFDGHVLSFHLNANPSTIDADFRINSGAVLHSSDYQETVESSLIFHHPEPLVSRDDGVLRLPGKLFAEAAYVDLRANARAHIKHFNLDGFPTALAYMRAHGCDIDETRN